MSASDDAVPAPTLDLSLSVDCPKCGATISLDVQNDGSWTPHCASCGWTATFAIAFTLP